MIDDTATTSTMKTHQQQVPSSSTSSVVAVLVPRHSGRVYVRGRIRRLWRPRYIELMDDGKLQYYEERVSTTGTPATSTTTTTTTTTCTTTTMHTTVSPPLSSAFLFDDVNSGGTGATAATTGSNRHHDYKYTLTVTGARILDATTIRDLHTGLPRGTFGFVVRGQRQQQQQPPSSQPKTIPSVPSVTDIMTESFVFAEEEHQGTTSIVDVAVPPPVRDYLCAVPTLEEAQMWVVALQWAASMEMNTDDIQPPQQQQQQQQAEGTGRSTIVGSSATTTVPKTQPQLQPTVVDHWWKVDHSTSMQNLEVSTNATITSTRDDVSIHTSSVTDEVAPIDRNKHEERSGKVLVTAVTGYSVVRYTTFTFEIVYNIHAMLLYNSNCNDNGNNNTPPQSQQQQQQQQQQCVEQWSMQRTAVQFQNVAAELLRRRSTNSKRNADDDIDSKMLSQLPTWNSRPTIEDVDQSLSILDTMLRSWILSPDVVNSDVLKLFLGLGRNKNDNNNNTPVKSNTGNDSFGTSFFKSIRRSVHCSDPLAISDQYTTTTVPDNISSDVYVRAWLQKVRRTGIQEQRNTKNAIDFGRCNTTIGLLSLLFKIKKTNANVSQIAIQLHGHHHEHNMLYFGGAAVAVIGMMPTIVPLWKYIMPMISIRFDYLLASWVGATYLGHRIGGFATSQKPKPSSSAGSRSKSNHVGVVPTSLSKFKIGNAATSLSSTSLKSTNLGAIDPEHQAQVPDSPKANSSQDNSVVMVMDEVDTVVHSSDMDDFASVADVDVDDDDDESDGEASTVVSDDVHGTNPAGNFSLSPSNEKIAIDGNSDYLSSPLPKYPENNGSSCWSQPSHDIFHVRGATYLRDKIKVCSGPSPLTCRGVDVWITDNPERHISRNPSVLGGRLNDVDTFLVNFLLPFGNLVAYFEIPPLSSFPSKLRTVWTKFLKGDQQYRDARLKLLPVVVDGPWIVKTAVGPGKSPALLGKAIPLQYFFRDPDGKNKKGIYEVDVIITASTIAKGILSVVKSQTKTVSIAFAFIIEAVEQSELPETVLCSFQVHSLHLEDCPSLPPCNLD